MSSPGMYPRCSAKSTEAPKYGERWSPLMNPSTTVFASSSRLPMRASTFGSTKRAPGNECCSMLPVLHTRSWCRHCFEQLIDDRVAGDPFRLGVEVREHA